MNEIKIEKGIKLFPRMKHGGWRETVIKMNIGDSILVPTRILALTAYMALKRLGRKGATRNYKGKFRVWRIK